MPEPRLASPLTPATPDAFDPANLRPEASLNRTRIAALPGAVEAWVGQPAGELLSAHALEQLTRAQPGPVATQPTPTTMSAASPTSPPASPTSSAAGQTSAAASQTSSAADEFGRRLAHLVATLTVREPAEVSSIGPAPTSTPTTASPADPTAPGQTPRPPCPSRATPIAPAPPDAEHTPTLPPERPDAGHTPAAPCAAPLRADATPTVPPAAEHKPASPPVPLAAEPTPTVLAAAEHTPTSPPVPLAAEHTPAAPSAAPLAAEHAPPTAPAAEHAPPTAPAAEHAPPTAPAAEHTPTLPSEPPAAEHTPPVSPHAEHMASAPPMPLTAEHTPPPPPAIPRAAEHTSCPAPAAALASEPWPPTPPATVVFPAADSQPSSWLRAYRQQWQQVQRVWLAGGLAAALGLDLVETANRELDRLARASAPANDPAPAVNRASPGRPTTASTVAPACTEAQSARHDFAPVGLAASPDPQTLSAAGRAQPHARSIQVVLAPHPPYLPLIGAARSRPNTQQQHALVFDFGHTYIKRAIGTTSPSGHLRHLHLLPQIPAPRFETLDHRGDNLKAFFLDTIANTVHLARARVSALDPSIVISLASYLHNGVPADTPSRYAPLRSFELSVLETQLHTLTGTMFHLRFLHDGTAAARAIDGSRNDAVILLGTALGVGLIHTSEPLLPLAQDFVLELP